MVYVNKPKPSKGYVSFFILVFLVYPGALLIIAFITTLNVIINPIYEPVLLPVFVYFGISLCVPMLILFVIFIHGAYNTEFRIEDGKLWMKFGYLRKESVPLDEIKSIEKVDFISGNWRPSFHNRSYCNRFKEGVGVITEKRTIWVSPEDSEEFVSKLGLKTSR